MLTQQQRLAGLSADSARRALAVQQSLQLGRFEEAERGVTLALALAPKHPEILRLYAITQIQRRRFGEAIDTLLAARAQRADDPLIENGLGSAYEAELDYSRALDCFRRASELGPEIAECWFNLGNLLSITGHASAAVSALERAAALAPQNMQLRSLLASMLNTDGRAEQARAEYRSIIAKDPDCGEAWWGLATLKPMPLDAQDIARMQRVLRQVKKGQEADRINIGLALANALEHQGDYAHAMAVFKQAHALAQRMNPWNAKAFVAQTESILNAFAVPISEAEPVLGEQVIFIVSLPRSGSTLIEQILASHSQVEGSTELPDMLQVIMDESDRLRQPFPQWVATRSPADWAGLGQRYLERTAHWRRQRPIFTDKMLGNWLYVGAILAMLPNAKVIIVRRDPLENLLGCYRHSLAGHAYTHDFKDLATYWQGFDRASRAWVQRYPGRVYEQVYERLQLDQEGQTRALLDFCGLSFEASCLNFHDTQRRVTTPSAAQVREPLRRDTARAAKYGALLDPLRLALGMPPFKNG